MCNEGFQVLTVSHEDAGSQAGSFHKRVQDIVQRIRCRIPPGAQGSQEYSGCGKAAQKSLAQRAHGCNSCGLVMDRDHNAAMNIRQRGIETLPVECREVTPSESMPLVMAQCHGQAGSLNEEANDFSRLVVHLKINPRGVP